jgi:hypothetical protein
MKTARMRQVRVDGDAPQVGVRIMWDKRGYLKELEKKRRY